MSGNPILAGVIGFPIQHSKSPFLHGYWLKRFRIRGHYVPFAISPENLERGLAALNQLGFSGVNVTIPHKSAVLELATSVSDLAARIGAANTLTFDGRGGFHADNTDCYGFLKNVCDAAPEWSAEERPALVVGAGGASRAIVAGLVTEGCTEIRVANRTRSRAEDLRRHFGDSVVVVDWQDLSSATENTGLIINTTSLGMNGGPELTIDLVKAPSDVVVTDIVYTPLNTPFLRLARSRGLKTVDGLGMLLHQAVPGFERWFGKTPTVDEELRQIILDLS
ncbi:shikimate dehydrogenase [Amaricoccus tamworthensis]|uniref:shikimate dehydrogenase n=1 Tax=Amaricoccus tamworthensis TaxID=57002 RepID=UPI003C7D76EF